MNYRPDGFYYGVRKQRFGWRAFVTCYGNDRVLWTESCGLPATNKRDAAIIAKQHAVDMASGHNPAPTVYALSDELQKLAAPVSSTPALFELRVDARPATARKAGTRYQEPGLFDL